ncbi:DUF5808 domain-containing protein [Streptacidiphilus monticola]|uniref:DUF5808 domain-containing protein n=1 Tax=Streptacidiphilus monticola TaxID=2161674 RepID=A0ABW1FWQ6_9ACTN
MASRTHGNALNRALLLTAVALVGAAVAKELARPAAERTWHGRIVGLPYDFRPPTAERLRAEFWAPDNPALFTPHAFGIGYGVNLARVAGRFYPPD